MWFSCKKPALELTGASTWFLWSCSIVRLLFRHSQLFGEEDADQEVSPDTADPEAACESHFPLVSVLVIKFEFIGQLFFSPKKCLSLLTCVYCTVLYTGNPEETAARATASEKDGDIKRVSTKEWARSTGYDAVKLFNKVKRKNILMSYNDL